MPAVSSARSVPMHSSLGAASSMVKKFFKIDKLILLALCSKSKAMSEKDYQRWKEFAAKRLEEIRKMTKEEALALLVEVGHLDKDGNFTEPYKHLATVVTSI
jgi:hypothetical protein